MVISAGAAAAATEHYAARHAQYRRHHYAVSLDYTLPLFVQI